jgi:YacP-like NYN domain
MSAPRTSTEPIVFVDARNVIRSRWPNLREDRFLELVRAWAERKRARLVVVFDGPAPACVLGSGEGDERMTVVGTGHESADDWIAREARRLSGGGRRLWLVSSDRGLRERLTAYVERMIGGGAYATDLEALENELRAAR